MRSLVRLGLGPRHTYVLSLRGRTSGKLYSTPVTLVEESGDRWRVAPHGEVSWVRNARAAGRVTLVRGRRAETLMLTPVASGESGPILKKYLELEPITRPYFAAGPDSPIEAFEAEAAGHPVFRLY